jgi:hypothetical protein
MGMRDVKGGGRRGEGPLFGCGKWERWVVPCTALFFTRSAMLDLAVDGGREWPRDGVDERGLSAREREGSGYEGRWTWCRS